MTQCVAAEMTKYQLRDGWHYYNYIILTCVLLVLPCPFLLIIYSQEKREEECERDCNHFFIANNILWKATNWRPIYHKTTQHYLLLSISLSEYWKMTFSLSLSLSLGGCVCFGFCFCTFRVNSIYLETRHGICILPLRGSFLLGFFLDFCVS